MDRTKVMSYTHDSYSEYNLEGRLVEIPQEASSESIAFAWSLNHENCFQCAFPTFDEKTKKRMCMYKKDYNEMIPLENYNENSRVEKFLFESQEYYYVPDEFRRIFRDMVKFLGHIHERGYCTNGVKKGTFYICDGTLKVQTWYRESSVNLIKDDYANVAHVIKSLLTRRLKRMSIKGLQDGRELDMLPDMDAFLGLLLKESIISDKKAITDHVAVITLKRVTRYCQESI